MYGDWDEAKRWCHGFKGTRVKSFENPDDARTFVLVAEEARSADRGPAAAAPAWVPSPPEGAVCVWTDGSSATDGAAGWAVYLGPDHPENACGRLTPDDCGGYGCTSQRGELQAMVRAAGMAERNPVHIVSDSTYALTCAGKWGALQEAKGFPTTPPHADLIKELRGLMRRHAGRITVEKVKAHSGVPGNEGADRLAKMGAAGTFIVRRGS